MNKSSLSQAELQHALHYDPITGIWTWRNPSKFSNYKVGDTAGGCNPLGYICITVNRKFHKAHRLAWLYVHGEWPNGEIDHVNQIRSDNRIKNLRVVSRSENQRNQKIFTNNTSGINGVCWHKASGKWCVQISGKYLGLFNCKYKAASVRHFAQEIDGGYTDRHGT